ncbi:MAG: M13 family metallopeptidase [Proteobacteria bacterium]|nr:M13 family metallopeptidase [Pseudomonadota bacterium]
MLRTLGISFALALVTPMADAALEGIQSRDLDRKVAACTDFYEFANGTWRAQNPVPASLPRWSRRVASHNDNWHRQQRVLEATAARKSWPRGSPQQVAGDFYASCMDEAAVRTAGIVPLQPLLAQIDQVRTLADLERNIRRLQDLAITVGFDSSSTPGYHDPLHFVAAFNAAALGLPDRDAYSRSEPRFVQARDTYLAHVATVLKSGGLSNERARAAAADILSLETRLAAASMDSATAADPVATDHMMTLAQLKALAPHFDWDAYFNEAGLPKVPVNIAEPKLLRQFDTELAHKPIATWKAYLQWRLLEAASPFLPGGTKQGRAQACVETTDSLFGDALAQEYVKVYFPPAAKAKAEEVVRNLRASLREQFSTVQWMAPKTKAIALQKLATTDVQVGYPDHWKDYSGVLVRRDTLWLNVVAGRRFNVEQDRRQVGKPAPRDFWLPAPTPSSADGYLIVELNKMVLPAGLLQPPFFNPDATDAVNYGAFGITVAHDLTHFIDSLGAANDVQGYPTNWWTDADRQQFTQHSQCVVDQFENYIVEPGTHLDGKRVLGEAFADLAGVHIAYAALEQSMRTHPVPVVDGFTPEQQFFISWGQATGAAMTPEAQRQLISSDPHPVPRFRVIGPLANSPEFQQAFSCKTPSQMIRPASKRCQAW